MNESVESLIRTGEMLFESDDFAALARLAGCFEAAAARWTVEDLERVRKVVRQWLEISTLRREDYRRQLLARPVHAAGLRSYSSTAAAG